MNIIEERFEELSNTTYTEYSLQDLEEYVPIKCKLVGDPSQIHVIYIDHVNVAVLNYNNNTIYLNNGIERYYSDGYEYNGWCREDLDTASLQITDKSNNKYTIYNVNIK